MYVVAKAGIEIPPQTRELEFPAGLVLPAEMVITTEQDGYTLQATVMFDEERKQFVCGEVRVSRAEDGPPVTGDALRSVRVKELLDAALTLAQLEEQGRNDDGVPRLGYVTGAQPPPGLAKQGPTDETLRWVAQAYELATVVGAPPTKSVQDQLGVSRATAGRWVAEARNRGLLPARDGDDDGDR